MLVITQKKCGKNKELRCDARELHALMQVGRDFSTWIKTRIEQYDFKEGEDYEVVKMRARLDSSSVMNQTTHRQKHAKLAQLSGRGGDRRSINYSITPAMAKQLATIENSDIGRKIRSFFIAREKQVTALLEERAERVLPLPGVKRSARDGINIKQLRMLQEQGRKIAEWLDTATGYFERHELHCQLRQINDALGLPTPPLFVAPALLEFPHLQPSQDSAGFS